MQDTRVVRPEAAPKQWYNFIIHMVPYQGKHHLGNRGVRKADSGQEPLENLRKFVFENNIGASVSHKELWVHAKFMLSPLRILKLCGKPS